MNVFRTFSIPYDKLSLAQQIVDDMGYPERGMFRVPFDESGETGVEVGVALISTGMIVATSPLLTGRQDIIDRLAEAGSAVTSQQVDELLAAMDIAEADPHERIDRLNGELTGTIPADPWVQPQGAHDAYAFDAAVTHGGTTWFSLIDANVWEPGVSGWREAWGSSGGEPPAWVQPTGAHDAYAMGEQVTHNGQTWESTVDANVWEPGVFGWVVVP